MSVSNARRASGSGGPMGITRSNRPGRTTAGSRAAIEFVAHTRSRPGASRTRTIAFSSSFTTACVSGRAARELAMSSTSSMNTTTCSSASKSSKARPSSSAIIDAPCAPSFDGKSSTKGQPSRPAIALANDVLPVPGGPNRSMADGATTPKWLASSASMSGANNRCSTMSRCIVSPEKDSHRDWSISSPFHRSRIENAVGRRGSSFSYIARFGVISKPRLMSAAAPT